MKEKSIVNAIMHALRQHRVYVVKLHGSAYMTPGLPDLWCVVDGRLVCLEVKQPGEKPTKRQTYEIERLWRAGATVAVVESVEEAMDVVFGCTARIGGAGVMDASSRQRTAASTATQGGGL